MPLSQPHPVLSLLTHDLISVTANYNNLLINLQDTQKVAACRYDWHQTATHVCVAVYAKLADPTYTYVEVNPIRLNAHIVFGDATAFTLDVELCGVSL